jgi:hypothetical protein
MDALGLRGPHANLDEGDNLFTTGGFTTSLAHETGRSRLGGMRKSRSKVEQSPPPEGRFKPIFEFDKGIRYCGVIGHNGRLIEGRARENLVSLEPESQDQRLFLQIALAIGMDRSWDKYFGATKCIVIAKEKINIFLFAISDQRSIIVATEPDLPVSKLRKLGQVVDTTDFGTSTGSA